MSELADNIKYMLENYPFQARETLEQLVELVAEMRDTLVAAKDGGWSTYNDDVITKADAILEGLK